MASCPELDLARISSRHCVSYFANILKCFGSAVIIKFVFAICTCFAVLHFALCKHHEMFWKRRHHQICIWAPLFDLISTLTLQHCRGVMPQIGPR
mmetsp:Transcript_34117/g.47500  ORF Transcript_34117/g.47500 Transcript_34117/m.47500 type:complete len:95 (+) Transcript_34117:99-383(+)